MKKLNRFTMTGLVLAFFASATHADDAHHHHDHSGKIDTGRVEGHAPIGVMGDHAHNAGEWMASYRYMQMYMDGNLEGTRSVSPQQVLESFMVTPLEMTMEMHMIGLMYAPTDQLTIMGMLPYLNISMDHRTRMGREFTTETSGFGDASVTALYQVWQVEGHAVHLNIGLGLPTGGIDEEDDTPAGRTRLPYPMQLGSGSFDFMPGVTYMGQAERHTWGAQAKGDVPLNDNDNDYNLGNRFNLTAWAGMNICKGFSVSARLNHSDWSNIDGADNRLNPMAVPTARTDLREGNRTDIGLGVNLLGQSHVVKGHRLAAEVLFPVRQNLAGPQLETDLSFVLGWQKAW